MSGPRRGALTGIRVLDFTWVGAGALTTRMLAEHGADVIKIESSAHLDSLRVGPPFAGGRRGVNRSGYFAERNANKRSVGVDLSDPQGVELVSRLAPHCDVVANNFRPGVMEKLGFGYETVRALRPDVVYLSMSMQGAEGPERDYLGYGVTINALAGLTHLTAEPGRYPVGTGTHYPDHVPNPAHAALAVLAALRHRRRTGEGQHVEMAQTEPAIAMLGPLVLEASLSGSDPGPRGNSHDLWAPHGVYPCAGNDRWIAIAVRTDTEWAAMVEVLGLGVESTMDATSRRAAAVELDCFISAQTSQRDGGELMAALQRKGVPAGVVQNARDLVDSDPQLAHRSHWRRLDHAEMGRTLYGTAPFRLHERPGDLTRAAPLLGEHTTEVLTEILALTADEIEQLTRDGVLR